MQPTRDNFPADAGSEVLRRAGYTRTATRLFGVPQRPASVVYSRGAVASARAFTLVELLLSVTMAVIIMLGVSQVFRTTSEAVGVGQAVSAAVRDGQALGPVLSQDFNAAVTDGAPFMLLRSSRQWAFRSQKDMQSAITYNAAGGGSSGTATSTIGNGSLTPAGIDVTDLDLNNKEGEAGVLGEQIRPADVNFRSHRTDCFSFFARGLFSRQTGNNGVFINDMASAEAYIWYGHLMLPNNTAALAYQDLGAGSLGTATLSASSNPNNFYATQWDLGRVAILLKDKNEATDQIFDNSSPPVAQDFIDRNWTYSTSSNLANNLSPLSFASKPDTLAPNSGSLTLLDSRYDLAGVSLSGYRQRMLDVLSLSNNTLAWWQSVPYGGYGAGTLATRFHANPFPDRPLTATGVAQASPILVKSCTQFIVEYAGDFVSQYNDPTVVTGANAYGNVLATNGNQPDGTIDFYVDGNGAKHIRWYGFPRSPTGGSTIKGNQSSNNAMQDVVPLRDVLNSAGAGYGAYGFEHFTNLPLASDYRAATPTGVSANSEYICAWGPNDIKPKMIRITVTIDDPQGRLGDGKTFEYIYTLP